KHMLARMTGLRRWVPAIDFDQGSPVPLRFVLKLTGELAPSHVTDGFGETVVLDHILDSQALDTHHLVFVDDACTELVLIVSSSVSNLSVYLGNRQTSLVPILGTFLLAGKLALGLCQFLLVLGKIVGIADVLTCRESDQTLDAQVKPDHLG